MTMRSTMSHVADVVCAWFTCNLNIKKGITLSLFLCCAFPIKSFKEPKTYFVAFKILLPRTTACHQNHQNQGSSAQTIKQLTRGHDLFRGSETTPHLSSLSSRILQQRQNQTHRRSNHRSFIRRHRGRRSWKSSQPCKTSRDMAPWQLQPRITRSSCRWPFQQNRYTSAGEDTRHTSLRHSVGPWCWSFGYRPEGRQDCCLAGSRVDYGYGWVPRRVYAVQERGVFCG